MTLVDTTCSSQLSLARTTGTPGSPDRQGCFEQREDPLQMCATNSVASVSRLEPEAGRECPWMSIQREEEKAPAWLAQSWQLLSGLGTIKAKCTEGNFQQAVWPDQTLFGSVLIWSEVYNNLPSVTRAIPSISGANSETALQCQASSLKAGRADSCSECSHFLTAPFLPSRHCKCQNTPPGQTQRLSPAVTVPGPGSLPAHSHIDCPCYSPQMGS